MHVDEPLVLHQHDFHKMSGHDPTDSTCSTVPICDTWWVSIHRYMHIEKFIIQEIVHHKVEQALGSFEQRLTAASDWHAQAYVQRKGAQGASWSQFFAEAGSKHKPES